MLKLNYCFTILCLALLSANESYGWFGWFCTDDVLESLIKCLLKTDIYEPLEAHGGLKVEIFDQRFECVKEAKCHPKLSDVWDRKIHLVQKFVDCMEKIDGSSIFFMLQGLELEKGLHLVEKRCRKKLAEKLPDDLKHYYLPLLGRK